MFSRSIMGASLAILVTLPSCTAIFGGPRSAVRQAAPARIIVSAPGIRPGAAVPGLAGAVWADSRGDGLVDGYVYQGQYYSGPPSPPAKAPPPAPAGPTAAAIAPVTAPATPAPVPEARGERG